MSLQIFISYRRGDSAYATQALYERLADKYGKDAVFFDLDTISIGVDFRKRLTEALNESNVLLAVIGDGWIDARRSEKVSDPKRCRSETVSRLVFIKES